jgi:hypothetical protein
MGLGSIFFSLPGLGWCCGFLIFFSELCFIGGNKLIQVEYEQFLHSVGALVADLTAIPGTFFT